MVGRHTVVFKTCSVVEFQFVVDLPVVGEVNGQFVLATLCVFRTELVETVGLSALRRECGVGGVDSRGVEHLWIGVYSARPLEGGRVVVEVVVPLVKAEAYAVVTVALVEFGGEHAAGDLSEVEPCAASFNESFVGFAVLKRVAVGSRHFADGASAEVHVVGYGDVHKFGVELPLHTVVERVVGEQCHFVRAVFAAFVEVPGLLLSRHDVGVGEGAVVGHIGVVARTETVHLLYGAVADVLEGAALAKLPAFLLLACLY